MEDLEEIKGGFLDLFVRSTSAENNVTNTSGTQSEHGGHSNTGTVLFLFTSFAVGALVRHVLKQTPIPYTVILICLGLAFGAASNAAALYDTLVDFTSIARIDPHLMQFVFLPILIFESAFVMDVHTFKKTIAQALILAGPGLMASTALTAVIVKFVFMFDWSWVAALVFGAIVSATDPVAVVAILKDVGASKQLGTIIEGESLLNDGAAIVLFNVLLYELIPGQSQTALQISVSFIRVAFGGPAFGYLVAKIAIFWLARVFNDALVEITITLASTYIAFYVGEGFFGVSGVLAVVTLGIELNSKRTNISPEVEVFLHRFWSMLGYLANTLIFILVGVVISQRAFLQVSEMDWMYVVPMYIAIMVIRLAVVGALSPLLMQFGYSIDWKEVIVVTWGGLRGAVGLSLALVVLQTPGIPQDTIGSKILFHTAGIVILTLLINATTVGYLLRTLGMSDISNTRQLTMTTAVRRVNEAKQRAVGMLKSDRFLADANWDYVDKKTEIDDPYRFEDYHFEELPNSMAAAANEAAGGNCPKCDTRVPRVPHPKELAELTEEVRLRMLKAEKTSYWRQYEQGMLGRQAVLILNNLADIAVDTKDRFITVKDIKPYWKIPFYYTKARALCLKALHWKSTADPPKPSVKCCIPFHKIVTHFIFEWTFFGIIILNVIFIIVELSIMDTLGLQVLSYFNYVFFTIYLLELILKIIGLRYHYFLSKWNWFDFIIFNALIVDIVVELTVPMAMENGFSPSILRIVRIIRVVRALRLTKFFLPLMIRLVDIIINNKLRFGYDIGKGFVVGVEEMLQQYERLSSILPHKSITRELRKRAEDSRLDVIRSLGRLRKEHPGVALSVKTHHAIRSVLNHCRDTIRQLLGSGVLDEVDAELLLNTIEVKMKRLERTPASLPLPDPKVILLGVSWLSGMDLEGESSVKSCAQLEYFLHKDIIVQCGERPKGLYIIVSGLVKVMTYQREECKKPSVSGENSTDTQFQAPPPPSGKNEFVSTDYYGAGSVIGEFALLEHRASNETVECDTDVQAFRINVEDMEGILATFPHLEEQLWRVNGIRTATELLAKLPEYQDWPANKLLLLCEDAYIEAHPDEPNPTFANSDVYREVVLVSGEVRCLNTRERLVAPVVIPRNMRYLLLISDQPQLLVIPKIQREMRKGSIEPDNVPVYRRKKSFSQKIRFGLAKVVRKVREVLRNAWNVIFKRLRLNRIMPKDSMSSTNVSEHNTSTHSVLDLEESVQNNAMPTIPTSAPPIMNRRIQSIIDRSVPPTSPSSAPPTSPSSAPPTRRL